MPEAVDRLDGLARAYEMHRPRSPALAFQALLARHKARKEPLVRELANLCGFMTARSCTCPWSSKRTAHGLIDLCLTRSAFLQGVVRQIGLSRVVADVTAICADLGLGDALLRIDREITAKPVRKRVD
jgi:hypothetical protein